jgi:hypothetical protein
MADRDLCPVSHPSNGGLVDQSSSGLTVRIRPVQTMQEQLAMEAALDTLIELALRGIVEEREYQGAVQRGQDPIVGTLPEKVQE